MEISNQNLVELIMEYFEEKKEAQVDQVLEYVETHHPNTRYQTILGTISRQVSAGQLIKKDRGIYVLAEGAMSAKESSLIPEEENKEQEIIEIVEDGIHPLLKRELTDNEKMIIENNAKIVQFAQLNKEHEILIRQMKDGTITRVMFFGDPGNGKTTIARKIADALKVPVYSQNFGINSEELDVVGGFVPDEENGGFKWVDGQFTMAFRNGGVYIAEEPNYAKPGVLGIKNNALDGVGQIVLRNGEVIQRHPAFRYIGCMNVGLAGTQRMNLAFLNRMQKIIKFEPLSKQKQVEIIAKESGYKNREVIKRMVDVGNQIKTKIKKEQIDNAEISIRNLIAWASDVRYTKNLIESAKPTIIWAVCMEEDELHEEILNDIILPRLKDIEA